MPICTDYARINKRIRTERCQRNISDGILPYCMFMIAQYYIDLYGYCNAADVKDPGVQRTFCVMAGSKKSPVRKIYPNILYLKLSIIYIFKEENSNEHT